MALWTRTDRRWLALDDHERAALMALLEARVTRRGVDVKGAVNVLGAMHNRAEREGRRLGVQVGERVYQPAFEPAQRRRIGSLIGSREHRLLTRISQARAAGELPDWVGGATHFLVPERTMLALEARNPRKYRSWRRWTGFDERSSSYRNVVFRDGAHAFLAPGGRRASTAPSAAPVPARGPAFVAPLPTRAQASGALPQASTLQFTEIADGQRPSRSPPPFTLPSREDMLMEGVGGTSPGRAMGLINPDLMTGERSTAAPDPLPDLRLLGRPDGTLVGGLPSAPDDTTPSRLEAAGPTVPARSSAPSEAGMPERRPFGLIPTLPERSPLRGAGDIPPAAVPRRPGLELSTTGVPFDPVARQAFGPPFGELFARRPLTLQQLFGGLF